MTVNNIIRKFLRHPLPHPDESISGYLIRLAESNGYRRCDAWSLFGLDGERLNGKSETLAYIYGCGDYSVLSRRTGFGGEQLKSLAYKPVQPGSQWLAGTYELFGHELSNRILRYKISSLCPQCLTEKSYQRKIWDLLPLTACPLHKCLLLDCCPDCGKPIAYRRDLVCFCPCGYDFRNTSTTLLPDEEIRLARRIYELCGFETANVSKETNGKMPDVLELLDLTGLLQSILLIAARTVSGDVWGKFLARRTIGERHRMLNAALIVYENFPVNFFEFLTSLKDVFRCRAEVFRPKQIAKRRNAVYHGVINLLDKSMAGSQFEFLRTAFREFLRREKLAACGINLDYTKTAAKDFFAAHVTLQEAARLLKKPKKSSKAIIANQAMRVYEGEKPNGVEVYYVALQDVERLQKKLARVISAVKAARSVGLYIYQMNQLIDAGIIEIVGDVEIKPLYSRVVDRQQVIDFYDSFDKAMRENPAYQRSGKKISSKMTFVNLGSHGINFAGLARMVLNGELAPAGRDEKKGINGFIYDEWEIRKLVKEKREEIVKDTLAVNEAATLLGVKIEIFRKLLQKNYLSFTETKRVAGRRFFREEVMRFRGEFIFSNEVAAKFSTSSEYVNRKLAAQNIRPVDAKLDVHNHLYRRDEIKDATIEKANPAAWTSSDRRERLRSLPETARLLNLTEDELRSAVRRKLIYVCRGEYRRDELFSERSITSFTRLDLPHVDFLREKESASMIEVSIKSFRKYVDRGLIVPELRPYREKSNSRFYSIKDLVALKKDISKD